MKKAHNAKIKKHLAHDVQKSTQDLQHLNDTIPGLLPDSQDTVHIRWHWEHQNGILHPNYYQSPTTNVIYMGEKVKIAYTHEMARIIYTTHLQ